MYNFVSIETFHAKFIFKLPCKFDVDAKRRKEDPYPGWQPDI